jgi:DNA-binding winged helix-turn-helix (wHTH) protein
MEPEPQIVFGPFRFDRTTNRLWQGPRNLGLRARTGAVLRYLLEHPGRVISRQEFAQHVWAETHVSQRLPRRASSKPSPSHGSRGQKRWSCGRP